MNLIRSVTGSGSIVINRPISDVFDFVAVDFFKNYPKWAPEVVEFESLSGTNVKIGSQFRQLRYDQAQKAEIVLCVTDFVANEQFILEAVTGEFRDSYNFESCNDIDATRITFCFEMFHLDVSMIPFIKLIRTAIEEGIDNSLENINNLIMYKENGASSESFTG